VLEVGSGNRSRVEEHYAFFESRSRAGYEGLELEAGLPYRSWTLWPNTCLLSLPGCENLIVIRMAPDGPEGCREHVDLLTIDGEVSPTVEALRRLFAECFNQEDIAIVESVQRGLKSLGYDQGRYVVDDRDDWYSESGLHKFHRLILAALAS
jgi:choline monooxygenase